MQNKWNIVLLQGEDVGRHLGCYGDDYADTPNLDGLAAEGARFTHAFSHSPVCAPSRGGMVTGCYPWAIGNHGMRSKLIDPPRNFTHELRDAGYDVSWPTKLDFNFEPKPGWCDDQEPWHEKPPPREPFFVYENFGATHESRMFPEPPQYNQPRELDLSRIHDPEKVPVPSYWPDSAELRTQVAKYYDAFTAIDREIGQRLQWLDEHGLRENTVVIFLSDHGRGLPREKRWCYDAGLHLPLIIRWPGELEAGSVSEDLVGWVDIAPTLLALAGVARPDHYNGQVFLGPEKAPPREFVFAGRDRMDEVFDKVRVARSKRWHYIRNDAPGLPYAQNQWYMEQQPAVPVARQLHAEGKLEGPAALFFRERKPAEELYDAESDPEMVQNLAGNPDFEDILLTHRAALQKHLNEVGDLGETTEEDLVKQGLVENRIPEYAKRQSKLPPEQVLGPDPIPMTLREAAPWVRPG